MSRNRQINVGDIQVNWRSSPFRPKDRQLITFDALEGLYLVQSYFKTTSGLHSFPLTQGQMNGELKRWSPQFTPKPMEKHLLDAALEQVKKRRRAKRLSLNRTAQPQRRSYWHQNQPHRYRRG